MLNEQMKPISVNLLIDFHRLCSLPFNTFGKATGNTAIKGINRELAEKLKNM